MGGLLGANFMMMGSGRQDSIAGSSSGQQFVSDKNGGAAVKYKELYHDVKQQLECEKKLNLSMIDVLENKVSEMIAENGTLKMHNIQLAKQH